MEYVFITQEEYDAVIEARKEALKNLSEKSNFDADKITPKSEDTEVDFSKTQAKGLVRKVEKTKNNTNNTGKFDVDFDKESTQGKDLANITGRRRITVRHDNIDLSKHRNQAQDLIKK